MSMSVGGAGDGEPMMEINTTPLIDIMLVLLVTLIVTLPVMTHAVKLDMPRPNTQPQKNEQPEVINLEIDFDGSIIWDGNVVPDFATLEGYFRTEAKKNPQPELHLRPNKNAAYDFVAKTLALAQRNGIERIGFVGNEQYMD